MKRIARFLVREPLVPFVALGAALYFTLAAVRPDVSTEVIEVPPETIRALVKAQEDLVGRRLDSDEIRTLVDGYVDDEVLIREARRQGFDRSDVRVRKQLLNVMRTTLDEPVPQPSVAQLQAHYRENADQFRSAPSISFEHVTFSWGSKKTPTDPDLFLKELQEHPDPLSLGDFSLTGSRMVREDRSRLVMLFGVEFAEQVLELPLQTWTGPIESRSGVHYVRIVERHPAELPPLEKIETYLRQQWEFSQRREIQQKKIDRLRQQYRVVIPDEYAESATEPHAEAQSSRREE